MILLRTIARIAIFAMLVMGGKLVAGKEILAHGANDGFGGGGFGHDGLSEEFERII